VAQAVELEQSAEQARARLELPPKAALAWRRLLTGQPEVLAVLIAAWAYYTPPESSKVKTRVPG
jgi:hypothetical protein